ncbi:sulfurtransferase [Millisia brevis]|uniref:sulfurtransferase n=1 Tax=Millisia brevis TaxID=264148 RepID=UPI0009FCA396|nr:sulfurtransferase [Millisia brevis]
MTAGSRTDVLITPADLAAAIDGGTAPVLLDVRWRLDKPDGSDEFAAEHLPGARYLDLDGALSDHAVTGRGRHPLPSGAALQDALRAAGVRDGVPVVVYDDWNRAGSARAWWVLTAAGLPNVRILDGGLAAWKAAGGALESGTGTTDPGDVTLPHTDLYAGGLPTVTAQQVDGIEGLLLDARAPERYRGEVEPVDPVAGHIPGARNLPSTSLLDEQGRFRDDATLDELFAAAGVDGIGPVTAYCGSGVTASVVLAALASRGVSAALFPGSWSQWSSEASNPVAVGDPAPQS